MNKILLPTLAMLLLVQSPAHAISDKYRKQLEKSGCTQMSEMQGCDIHKSKAENAKAGFGEAKTAAPADTPKTKTPDTQEGAPQPVMK